MTNSTQSFVHNPHLLSVLVANYFKITFNFFLELLENMEEMFHQYYMHSDVCDSFKYSTK